MYDVIALGELLIDFSPIANNPAERSRFEQHPGGAPANVLACLARFGKKVGFIGKVGQDAFGDYLAQTLQEHHIDASGLVRDPHVHTTLAFVHLDGQGDRSFTFYRSPGADMRLSVQDIDLNRIAASKIFHFGSISMTDEPARSATLAAIEHARSHGVLVSYDPNLRVSLWDSLDEAKEMMKLGLQSASIVKLSQEELAFITGIQDCETGTRYIYETYGTALILVTLGKQGCFYRCREETGSKRGYPVHPVDTTGAGDAYLGAMLYRILCREGGIEAITGAELDEYCDFANAVGAIVTTKIGAMGSIPVLGEVERFLSKFNSRVRCSM